MLNWYAVKVLYCVRIDGEPMESKLDAHYHGDEFYEEKLMLVQAAKDAGVPIISSMGTGNKLDPTAFRVADIHETSVCPLARIIRKECRKRGIDKLKVVYSEEDPIKTQLPPDDPAWAELPEGRNALPGSVCFVPAVAGMIIAGEVIKDLKSK